MDDTHIFDMQRALRRRLFEGEGAIRWRPARDLAAQMLLYLDEPRMCWQLAADWVRNKLDADRADGGFGGFQIDGRRPVDYVALAESQRPSIALPAVLGHRFSAGEPSIRALWQLQRPTPVIDVSQQASMTPAARSTLINLGTAAKLALPVSDGARPVGLLCADWHRTAPHWRAADCNELSALASGLLGPVLGAAMSIARMHQAALLPGPDALDELTPAEARVAGLIARGLSYKEVARELNRSVSTIDHQLRSIRQKLGMPSTSRLVRYLSERQAR